MVTLEGRRAAKQEVQPREMAEPIAQARLKTPQERTFMVQLNALRGLAVIGVIYFHYGPKNKIQSILTIGDLSVRLFFVLSGFLITGILIDARNKADLTTTPRRDVLKAFYIRRFLRIFPLYYAVLALCYCADVRGTREFMAWHLTYTTNFLVARENSWLLCLGHLWSLAVEEQFYLIWPALVLFVPERMFLRVFVATICIGPLSRGLIAGYTHELIPTVTPIFCCLDSLGMGALLALLQRRADWASIRPRFLSFLLISSGIVFCAWFAMRAASVGFIAKIILKDICFALFSTWVIDRASYGFKGRTGRFLEWPPLVKLGVISYCMYIMHDILINLDISLFQGAVWRTFVGEVDRGLPAFFFNLLVSTIFALLSWHFFEKPINNLKSFFPYIPKPNRVSSPERSD